jgi:hypothetical protein
MLLLLLKTSVERTSPMQQPELVGRFVLLHPGDNGGLGLLRFRPVHFTDGGDECLDVAALPAPHLPPDRPAVTDVTNAPLRSPGNLCTTSCSVISLLPVCSTGWLSRRAGLIQERSAASFALSAADTPLGSSPISANSRIRFGKLGWRHLVAEVFRGQSEQLDERSSGGRRSRTRRPRRYGHRRGTPGFGGATGCKAPRSRPARCRTPWECSSPPSSRLAERGEG